MLSHDPLDTDTLIIVADSLPFRIKESKDSTELFMVDMSKGHPWFDMVCGYGDMIGVVPHIMRIEAIDPESFAQLSHTKEEGWSELIYQ